MKVVVQRSRQAKVTVNGEIKGKIEHGLVVLVGVTHDDTEKDAAFLAEKVANLRIFEDEAERMNLSVKDVGGSVLSVSQFTLYGDCRKGRRPNFMDAAKPEPAEKLYKAFNQFVKDQGVPVQTGEFGAMMDVSLVNDGPVTLIIDSDEQKKR
ncbi:D-tyrosyl-tRNA(Tyr) deacylase [Melghiribacillus thermohalophilus]|uniref:D-aminoacyl-tRNA deacylase n=1 Tax=Melghiribacillus thermohalophilus TaxID=1324956 RepID=A0A4R3NC90_9BACI|nr:D-aminoacyl-tRNA deacylase [Melghiribacillus thermohalophilus]TCT27094.1 D-tyrosyl-tRNA(Tyr) deacylase [Melghiribacillus thermohalophilus]